MRVDAQQVLARREIRAMALAQGEQPVEGRAVGLLGVRRR